MTLIPPCLYTINAIGALVVTNSIILKLIKSLEDVMETLVILAQASAYFAVFLIACGFLWFVSIYADKNK